ncbi:cytochrome P450 [Xylariomycetidae sp. FL0641]|nr:cytochrome P450 [Xylariomycetidae sp. FL0641]
MLKPLILAVATAIASYLYLRLRYLRFQQYAHIPQLPNHLLWGHLKVFGEFMARGIQDRHPDKIFEEMWISIGRPPVMLVDMRPVSPPMLLIPSHDLAEQVAKPSKLFPLSTPKSPTWTHMIPIVGETSILGKEGQDWKDLRKKYSTGFSTQHLWSLLPLILEKMKPFYAHLDHFAASGEAVSLETLISNLTIDVIGAAVMEADLQAQHLDPSSQGEVVRLLKELLQTYIDDKNNLPWWIVPRTMLKRNRLAARIQARISQVIQQNYAALKEEAEGHRSRGIAALSIQGSATLTPQLLSETADQVRTFLFAGFDTNTSVLQWVFYELSRTPRALQAVRDELDRVLGRATEPREICAELARSGEQLLPRLQYVHAVIKETLRLHPPASTARMAPPGAGFTVRASAGAEEEYDVDGLVLYSCQSVIQRDPAVYGDDADDWVPERWLGEGGAAEDKIPPGAWRPFERGPRSCIGLELANLEARIMVATVARRYDFVKVGLGECVCGKKGQPVLDGKGRYKVKSELYNTRRMTSKPVDGTLVKVKLAA